MYTTVANTVTAECHTVLMNTPECDTGLKNTPEY